jgi:hypothetical protein
MPVEGHIEISSFQETFCFHFTGGFDTVDEHHQLNHQV